MCSSNACCVGLCVASSVSRQSPLALSMGGMPVGGSREKTPSTLLAACGLACWVRGVGCLGPSLKMRYPRTHHLDWRETLTTSSPQSGSSCRLARQRCLIPRWRAFIQEQRRRGREREGRRCTANAEQMRSNDPDI